MNRLMLRFGNQRADTIAEHVALLDDSDFRRVWWGWWAKAWERIPTADEWQAISEACQGETEIGLFDRRALRFYLARCDDVRVSDGRSRIQSPEPSATPSYYSAEFFPAWFRLTGLSEITETEFRETFGFVPLSLDRTLFWDDPASPPEEHVLDIVPTTSPGILHISDLHFGDDFGFRRDEDQHRALRQLENVIVEYVRESDTPIGVVVATGDLITQGRERYFRDVTRFLDALLQRLGLERQHVVVVPGNHDVWLESDESFTYSHDYAHETGYREWHDGFFGEEQRPIERVRLFDVSDGPSLGFVQVNSARLRERETMEYGYVGRHRYENLLRTLAAVERTALSRFFVMHHHVAPVPSSEAIRVGKPISVTVDAGQIVEDLQRYDVSYILHGHQHLPFVGSIGRMSLNEYANQRGHEDPITVLGCGSTGAKASRLSPALPLNTFGLYNVRGEELDVRLVQCSPEGFVNRLASSTVGSGERNTR